MKLNPLDFMCIQLSQAGYGSVDLLKTYDVGIFLNIWDYEMFRGEYEAETMAMNEAEK